MKKLGLPSVVATGVGLIVATSCLLSLGQGSGTIGITFILSMAIACLVNIFTALSLSELNALMPNLTGGLAQYTMVTMGPFVTIITMVGGYLVCNSITGSVECAMFGNTINSVFHTGIPSNVLCIVLLVALIIVNLNGVDMFAKIQDVVAYGLVFSLIAMGLLGIFHLGTGQVVSQPLVIDSSFSGVLSMVGIAFFLFLGCEFIIPIAKDVKNPRRNVPLGMVLSLLLVFLMQTFVVLGFHSYVTWSDLAASTAPHILYGTSLLGLAGTVWMVIVSVFAVVSTVNTVLSSLPQICAGMAKLGLLPDVFQRRNRKGVPYIGTLMIGGIMIFINAKGLSTSSQLSFLILIGCVFWMICYIISNLNVLILRKRMPRAPRTFKVPLGPLFPILGILGNVIMIWNISGDPAERLSIYRICLLVFAFLAVYALVWIRKKMRIPLFRPMEIKNVMAMENDLYFITRKHRREEAALKGAKS